MTAQLQVRASDALTGEVIWNFDPYKGIAVCRAKGVNRGVTYWSDGEHRRIFVSAGPTCIALMPAQVSWSLTLQKVASLT